MAIYDHKCEDCGPIIVETETIAEYLDFKEKYGVGKGGNVQVPCPNCGKMARRDYSAGIAPFKVKGGTLYKSEGYSNDVKKNWYREEVKNTKEVLRFRNGVNPYSHMSVASDKEAEGMGFVKTDIDNAKARAKGASTALGETKAKVANEISKL